MEYRTCSKCNTKKPVSQFSFQRDVRGSSHGYYSSRCRECAREYQRTYARKITKEKNTIQDCFWFLNNSIVGKMHPTRKISKPRKQSYGDYRFENFENPPSLSTCLYCGKQVLKSQLMDEWMCRGCYIKRHKYIEESENSIKRIEQQMDAVNRADEYREMLQECTAAGTCDVLAAHHEFLLEDPERLTTQFLVNLICKKEYTPGSKEKLSIRRK